MGAVISHVPQDLNFEPCRSYCRIGDGTIIREYATVHRGSKPDTETVIGDDCFIMSGVHIAHNCNVADNVIIAQGAMLGGHVEIGEGTFVGGNAGVHQFCRVGRLSILSGFLGLSMDMPPFHRAVGLNRLNGLNSVGMKRAGLSKEVRRAIKEASRVLFRGALSLEEACAKIEAETSVPEALELVAFCRASTRGVARQAIDG